MPEISDRIFRCPKLREVHTNNGGIDITICYQLCNDLLVPMDFPPKDNNDGSIPFNRRYAPMEVCAALNPDLREQLDKQMKEYLASKDVDGGRAIWL